LKPSKAQLQIKLKRIFDSIQLSQCGWKAGEDIMTFNGTPIGMTIHRNIAINRWWPDLKTHLAEHIANELSKK
jgi:hypothetical protein